MRRILHVRFEIIALVASLSLACSSDPEAPGESIYDIPASLDALVNAHYYDIPYPSEARMDTDGTVRFAGFYMKYENVSVRGLVNQSAHLLKGFSLAAPNHFRFTKGLVETEFPSDPQATTAATSPIQLIDIDRTSPDFGKRIPLIFEIHKKNADEVYFLGDTLSVRPALGTPLRPKTRYATIVRRGIRDTTGGAITRARGVGVALGLDAPNGPGETAHAALFADVAAILTEVGVPAAEVLHFTAFHTDDPTRDVFAIADYTRKSFPAPTFRETITVLPPTTANYDAYEGTYGPSPNFQEGVPPYRSTGGGFVFDAAGVPQVQSSFDLRFILAVPPASLCPMPATGYPIVIYAHGTGGSYRSVVDEDHGLASMATSKCMAAIGTDQIFHGTRPGAPDPKSPTAQTDIQLSFFNLFNAPAGRSNPGQSGIDVVQEARLFTERKVQIPAAVSKTGAPILFDASNVTFMGHSQGGINGPIFLASDNQTRGGVLSGTGAMISISLVDKVQPEPPIPGLVKAFIGLYSAETSPEYSFFHPVLGLVQTVSEIGDPLSYMKHLVREPRPGFAPKSILQTEGVRADGSGDNYAPVRAIETASVEMGLPLLLPSIHPVTLSRDVGTLELTKQGITGNLADGKATGALAQFEPAGTSDGHFVVFKVPAARTLYSNFLRSLADNPIPTLK